MGGPVLSQLTNGPPAVLCPAKEEVRTINPRFVPIVWPSKKGRCLLEYSQRERLEELWRINSARNDRKRAFRLAICQSLL